MAGVTKNSEGGSLTKSEKTQKAETVKDIHQIKIKLQTAEREKNTRLYSKQSDFHRDFQQLEEMDRKMGEDIKNERLRLAQQISKIKRQVASFRHEIQNVKPTPEFVEKLKDIMESIEANIADFKATQQQKYEELKNEEWISTQEVDALEKRIESWSSAPPIQIPTRTNRPISAHRDITKDLPPEVATFERFVQQTGGPRGGWDEYDHGTFMKYRNRSKGKAGFLQEASRGLPTKTEEEVFEHEKWYREYLRLNDLKKTSIKKWKEHKELDKLDAAAAIEEVDREDEERKEKEAEKKRIFDQERIVRRKQLNAWKVQKEIEKATAEEKKLRQEMEQVKAAERERQRQAQIKDQVLAIKAAQDEEKKEREYEEQLAKQMAMEAKRKEAKDEISRFQQRDLYRVLGKVQQKKMKEEAEKEKQRRLESLKSQIGVKVERDPSRLLRPTKGWEERQKDQTSSGGQVLHMPHRAVPSWRAGLS